MKYSVASIVNNKNIKNVINTIVDYIANKLGDILITKSHPAITKNGPEIWELLKKLTSYVFTSTNSQDLVLSIFNDLIKNPSKYKNINSIQDLISSWILSANRLKE